MSNNHIHNQNHHNNHNKLINHHRYPSSSTTSNRSTITSTRSNSTTQACAACRYQRRKCAPDCVLAPYFPHDRQRQFQNAHKLFGVSNITKIIKDLDPPQKDEAMRTIIYQSDVRAHDPVGGCYRIIRELQRHIEYTRAELDIVLHQLAICRTHAIHNQQNQDQIIIDGVDCDIRDPNLYEDDEQHHGLDLDLGQIGQTGQIPQQQDNKNQEEYILSEQNCEDDNAVQLQEINSWANMNNSPSSTICLEVKPQSDECQDFKPLLINEIPSGERHEFKFEFDEINEPSSSGSGLTLFVRGKDFDSIEEILFNEGNEKGLIKEENVTTFFTKEENVSYQQHNEDHDLKEHNSKNCGIPPTFVFEYIEEKKKQIWQLISNENNVKGRGNNMKETDT
ncbi:LOB domain-containing protein 22-like [Rutidosis leptorrhynchoides]|uniref:LOB domain-containing protein 22-like n=1 Tax=Rutidosis leptorrhynchoides TaxID=125765 RepID=UPI003A9A1089